jgi:hypothetical protein
MVNKELVDWFPAAFRRYGTRALPAIRRVGLKKWRRKNWHE